MKLLKEIDSDLEMLSIRVDNNRQRMFIILLMISMNLVEVLLTVGIFFSLAYHDVNINISICIFLFNGFVANFVVVNQFLTWVCGICDRCKIVK